MGAVTFEVYECPLAQGSATVIVYVAVFEALSVTRKEYIPDAAVG